MTHEIRSNSGTEREGKEEKEREREGGKGKKKKFWNPSPGNLAPPLPEVTCKTIGICFHL
jgi:hypothetical protein